MFACLEKWNMHDHVQWTFSSVQWIRKCSMNFFIKLLMIVFATSISILILTFLNNVCETHRRLSVNVWIHFCQRNIIYCRDLVRVIWLYIAVDRNDVGCSKCHRRFMFFHHRQLSISTTFVFNLIMNCWQQISDN